MRMVDNHKNERDEFSGIETTGHDWDGIKELNNPAPRWWLWVFFVCIAFSVFYWIIYPAWPTLVGNTKGSRDWTQYKKLSAEQNEIAQVRGEFGMKIKQESLEAIQADPQLYSFAIAGGKAAFKENCAACHGSGAQGGKGYPNLNDDDWLWGGKLSDIYATIKYGIRSGHDKARFSQMPAFGQGMLKPEEISTVAEYVLALSGAGAPSVKGAEIFKQNCASCHGDSGKGNHEFGAPNLTDAIVLYGSDKRGIASQISSPRGGVMPVWEGRLPDEVLKQLAIYVYSLGGGEAPGAKK